jgi:hypothetical protein
MITVKVNDETLSCPYEEWLAQREFQIMQEKRVMDLILRGKL